MLCNQGWRSRKTCAMNCWVLFKFQNSRKVKRKEELPASATQGAVVFQRPIAAENIISIHKMDNRLTPSTAAPIQFLTSVLQRRHPFLSICRRLLQRGDTMQWGFLGLHNIQETSLVYALLVDLQFCHQFCLVLYAFFEAVCSLFISLIMSWGLENSFQGRYFTHSAIGCLRSHRGMLQISREK